MSVARLFLVMVLSGCTASGAVASPREVASRVARAAQQGDADALHAMLTREAQAAMSREVFAARVGADRGELTALGRALDDALTRPDAVQVLLPLRAGGDVTLVDEQGVWRVGSSGLIEGADVTLAGVQGARAAVRAFHDVLAAQGIRAWASVLSARAAGDAEATIAAIMAATEDPSALPVVVTSSMARFTLPDGRWLVTVWERGAWRVESMREAE